MWSADDRVPMRVTVNGTVYDTAATPRTLLVHLLREDLDLTGPHVGCVVGRCGACTVIWEGKVVKSCMVLAVQADGTEVETVEGLADPDGTLHPLQESFWANDAAECGYCTPGMLMAACGLLRENPAPDDAAIRRGISGNLCRCTGYVNIVKAIADAAVAMADAEADDAVVAATAKGE